MTQLTTLTQLVKRPESFNAFEAMLTKAQNLHKAGFFEFAIIQCHITMDYFINAILETNFMPKLNSLRDQDPDIHKLFLKAIWETDEERKYLSFTERFGKYVSALGFDFAGYTAKGGRKFYKELEKLNALRNGIVHNRYFGSDVTSNDVLENIQLCRDVIALFLKQFNSSHDFSVVGSYSAYSYKENDLVVRVQERGNNRIEKTTDLYYEFDLTFFSREHKGVIVPKELTDVQPKFRSFALRVCGLDYIRYGVDKTEKSSQLCPFEPNWHNGNLFALKVNLNFYEIARDFESILTQKEASIKGLLAKLITEKYEQMLQSWEGLDFVDRVSLSRLFAHLFNLSNADPLDTTSTLTHALGNLWKVAVITGPYQISFMSLNDVSKLEGRRFVLTERSNPSEISFLARAAHRLGFLDGNIVIVLPGSQPRQAFVDFVKKFLCMNGAECAGEEAMKELEKEISLKHKDRNLSKYSDYDLVATGCDFLEHIAEIINGRPHINGDHWFSKKILSLMWALPQEQGAEILYLIENINETLEGRRQSFTDINNFRDELRKVLNQAGVVSESEGLLSISESDFPPGFFTWKKILKGIDELFTE